MAERTKRYLIKLNYKSLDIKYKNALAKQVEDDKFQRNIIKQNQNFMIIKVALFDYLIYLLERIKKYNQNIRVALLAAEVGKEDKEVEVLVDDCSIGSDEYNEIIRTLRF